MPTDDRSAQLSAFLDGELSSVEEADVRAWLADSADARDELAGLRQARQWLRELPPVDPPFGFYERMRPADRRRHFGAGGLVGAAAAVLVAMFVLVGVTPPAEAMVPPVDEYVARHEMVTAGGSGVATVGTNDYAPVEAGSVSTDAAAVVPDALGGQLSRSGVWRADDGVHHAMYGSGTRAASVYSEPGVVSWSGLPDSGQRTEMAGEPAWWMRSGAAEVIVVQRGTTVVTLVATIDHDAAVALASTLPAAPEPSLVERARRAAEDCNRRFGLSG
jgi:anti-sigma factor RsiW